MLCEKLTHDRRDIGRVGVGEDVGETIVAAALEELLDRLGQPFRFGHGYCSGGRASGFDRGWTDRGAAGLR